MSIRSSKKLFTQESVLLKRMREAAGLSMRDAAKLAEVSVANINHLENGRQNIRDFHLKKLLPIYKETEQNFKEAISIGSLPNSKERIACMKLIESFPEDKIYYQGARMYRHSSTLLSMDQGLS